MLASCANDLVSAIENQLQRPLQEAVRAAFLAIPRHHFLEEIYQQHGNSLSWDHVVATPPLVYRDEALVTQIDEQGFPSSSSSQPSVMAPQLEALDLQPGHRVLEIGAGTGYNAALLGLLVEESGQVISIDLDPELVLRAQEHLQQFQLQQVSVFAGDGYLGYVQQAPYDHILATAAFTTIPSPWVDQLTVGGTLVGNWILPLVSTFLCVEKQEDQSLKGRFLPIDAQYMKMRGHAAQTKKKMDWKCLDTESSTCVFLSGIGATIEKPACALLVQYAFPDLEKRYRGMLDTSILTYLVEGDTVIKVEDDQIHVYGQSEIGQKLVEIVKAYQKQGEPDLSTYTVRLIGSQWELTFNK